MFAKRPVPPVYVSCPENTTAVMGGEDWEMWIQALADAKLLAPGATSVAYSYIGPIHTWPIYKDGTIGRAKIDLERAARAIDDKLKAAVGGRAFISVNKALVTQASSAIPIMPLYISLLYKVMKEEGTHEGCIEQLHRLFTEGLYTQTPRLDDHQRLRMDNLELNPATQAKVEKLWPQVTEENLFELTDYKGYNAEFLKLFGFGAKGVDYDADVSPVVQADFH